MANKILVHPRDAYYETVMNYISTYVRHYPRTESVRVIVESLGVGYAPDGFLVPEELLTFILLGGKYA